IVFIALDLLGISGEDAGGSIAHLGGAVLGYVYIIQLRKGNDWSKLFIRKNTEKKTKFKVYKNNENVKTGPAAKSNISIPDQDYIDSILDKISQSGYDNLTPAEKE